MNSGDVTKTMLEGLVVKFNANIVSKDQPLPDGKKKGETKARLEKELVSAAKELLQPGDEQFFDETDIALMNALGINFARLTKTTPLVGESAETTECNLEDEVTPPAVEEAPVEAPTTPVKKKRGAKKAAGATEEKDDKAVEGEATETKAPEAEKKPRGRGKKKEPKTPKEPKAPKAKKEKSDPTKSNKGQIFTAFSAGETDPEKLSKLIGDKVKLSTIKAWLKAWPKGKSLPAAAKATEKVTE